MYFELGQTYADDNKIDKGIAYLDTSILFMNDNFYGYNCRGIMNRAIRNYEKALADFNTAAAIDSTNGVAFANIAGVYCDIKDYSSALKFVKKAELNNFDIYSVKAFQNLIRNHTKEEIFKTSTTFPPNND
ncbi:hypothetical protein J1N10_03015 [Carboxylicivirga sp. A043]|uniref:tetratricopeptide repeat protein n=1 Tax=Carboxylicivirga litoralis TaxID=2816963 RepID=UPI0021CB34D0|nr:hypothetical protein [Carboxylicivirga sp. A043]MCU4154930.1 hypothetical protein [Carboxylicivirga sp. A043]